MAVSSTLSMSFVGRKFNFVILMPITLNPVKRKYFRLVIITVAMLGWHQAAWATHGHPAVVSDLPDPDIFDGSFYQKEEKQPSSRSKLFRRIDSEDKDRSPTSATQNPTEASKNKQSSDSSQQGQAGGSTDQQAQGNHANNRAGASVANTQDPASPSATQPNGSENKSGSSGDTDKMNQSPGGNSRATTSNRASTITFGDLSQIIAVDVPDDMKQSEPPPDSRPGSTRPMSGNNSNPSRGSEKGEITPSDL